MNIEKQRCWRNERRQGNTVCFRYDCTSRQAVYSFDRSGARTTVIHREMCLLKPIWWTENKHILPWVIRWEQEEACLRGSESCTWEAAEGGWGSWGWSGAECECTLHILSGWISGGWICSCAKMKECVRTIAMLYKNEGISRNYCSAV